MRKPKYILYKYISYVCLSFIFCFLPNFIIKLRYLSNYIAQDGNSVKFRRNGEMADQSKKQQLQDESNVLNDATFKRYKKVNIQGSFILDHIKENNMMLSQDKWLTIYPAKGRLGNQMFQIASLLGIADKFKYHPLIPVSNFDLHFVFEMQNTKQITVDLSESFHYQESSKNSFAECDVTRYSDMSFLKRNAANWTLDGYLQSYKHFWHIQNIVRNYFTFKSDILREARIFMDGSASSNTVKIGIHARRGDFLNNYHMNLGRVTPEADYYKKAMDIYSLNYTNATFYIFSNDLEWCQSHLQHNRHKIVFSPYTQPGYDLALMSLCDHMIISVGTFGWWGGWLAGGSVIYYNGYPKSGSEISKNFVKEDIYPPFWLGIS